MLSSSKQLRVLHICQRDDLATGGSVRVAVEYVKRFFAKQNTWNHQAGNLKNNLQNLIQKIYSTPK